MAGTGTSTGKKGSTAPRVAPLKIYAARKPLNTTDSISASLCVGAQLKLTILDYYTGQPVQGARARRVDVEHFKDSHGALATADQEFFDLPYPAPDYAPAFTKKDEDALDKTEQELEKIEKALTEKKKVDFKAMSKFLDQRSSLVQKRRRRLEWCRFLQCAVKILMGWRSDKPYTGPHDGSNWDQFEKEFLAPLYRAVTGRAYDDAKSRYRTAASELQDAIARMFITDKDGVLLIPLPVGHTGKVTIEMTHLKLLDPADVPKLGPVAGIRAEYERAANDFKADEPGATTEKSRWKLVSDKHAASLRNFICIGYDTTTEKAVQEPHLVQTFTMLWCQPTWFETTVKGIIIEPDNKSMDKRGLKNGVPTLSVSTSTTIRGHWYGSFGDMGRADPVNLLQHIVEDPKGSGTWYWLKQKSAGDTLITDWDKSNAELTKRHQTNHPEPATQMQYRIVQPGAGFHTVAGAGDVKIKGHENFAWVLEWYRDPVKATSREDALMAAARQASGGEELLERTDDGNWRVRRPKMAYKRYEVTEDFDTIEKAIDVGIARKMHRGIDCSGDVGDPIFAIGGGTINHSGKVVYNSDSAAGLICTVANWQKTAFAQLQYLHMQENFGKAGTQCKTGDVVGLMGRTGNPVSSSPTHVHFQCGQDLTDCILPGYEQLFPWNGQPKLLPCVEDWYETAGRNSTPPSQEDNSNPHGARCCRALPDFRTRKENTIPEGCWAIKEGLCPHLTQQQWIELKAADAAEKAAREKEEAERKLREQEEKKKASKAK